MANEEPKVQPEGKFAETLRKSREKRAGMQKQQVELPAKSEERSAEGEVKGEPAESS